MAVDIGHVGGGPQGQFRDHGREQESEMGEVRA